MNHCFYKTPQKYISNLIQLAIFDVKDYKFYNYFDEFLNRLRKSKIVLNNVKIFLILILTL